MRYSGKFEVARNLSMIARDLNHTNSGGSKLPPHLFLTENHGSAALAEIVRALPQDTAILFRNYDDPMRPETARQLAGLAKARALPLLIAADEELASTIEAEGLHLPEYRLKDAKDMRRRHPDWILTGAVHSKSAIETAPPELDALLLSPVFQTTSHPDRPPLALSQASLWAKVSPFAVYALGGISDKTAPLLKETAFSGIAGISCFERDAPK